MLLSKEKKKQNFLTHKWIFDGDVMECARCCARNYDEIWAYIPCGKDYSPALDEVI